MTHLTPAYKLTLGDRLVDTTDEPRASTVVELVVSLDMDTPADQFRLVLGQVGALEPEREDAARIELGYADGETEESGPELEQVMAGSVVTVEPGLETRRVIGHSAAQALLTTFIDQTYESKTAGEIVRDLADRAEVEVAVAEDGVELPAYVVDGRRSAWHHARDLADLMGFDLYVDRDGELVFQRFAGGRITHVFEYAKHLVELTALHAPPRAGTVEAWGESPGASRGDASWAWLTKDFSRWRGTEGSGAPTLLLERPALRTSRAAALAASAAETTLRRRTLRGRLIALGRPQVRLGDALRLRGVPDDDLDQVYQVRSVTHRLTKSDGFTTTVGFRSLQLDGGPRGLGGVP